MTALGTGQAASALPGKTAQAAGIANPAGPALEHLLRERRLIVCVGAGGVGKTTIAAALALAAARRGRRVLVCTIDPARRLATSLGIGELGNEEREVPPNFLRASGVILAEGGSLHAMMLDTKRTFDRLISRYAPSPEAAERILANSIYQKVSSELSGSREYMSMEKLYELHMEGRYDLVVLDTPPTKHALDFLNAPKRLTDFLQGSVFRWFVLPYFEAGRIGMGFANRLAQKALTWIEDLFGLDLLKELNDFFRLFENMYGGFKERAEKVGNLMRSAELCAFVLVTSPTRETIGEALRFYEQLRAFQMPVVGVVANRVHPHFVAVGKLGGPLREAAAGEQGMRRLREEIQRTFFRDPVLASAVMKAVSNFFEFERLAEADRVNLQPIVTAARSGGIFVCEIPALEEDVHDIAALDRIDRYLLGEEAPVAAG